MADWLQVDGHGALGLACRVTILKSQEVHTTASGKEYVRRNAGKQEISGRQVADLALSKGSRSYEDKLVSGYEFDRLAEEDELIAFLVGYSPTTDPLRSCRLTHRVPR